MKAKHIFITIGTKPPSIFIIMNREEIIIPDEPGNDKKAAEILTEAVSEVHSIDLKDLYWSVFAEKNDEVPTLCSES